MPIIMRLWYNGNMRGVKRGFTLVELSLSIAFIAILSITITLIINDAISTYRRGVTLNQLNTVGMDLVDDMRSAVGGSVAVSLKEECKSLAESFQGACEGDDGKKLMIVRGPKKSFTGVNDVYPYGAFCTGEYSYIWNSGYVDAGKLGDDVKAELHINGSEYTDKPFRLLKIADKDREVCMNAIRDAGSYNGDINGSFRIANGTPEILLEGGSNTSNRLALYDLSAMPPVTNGNNTASLYSVSFILGTVDGGINVMSNGNFCQTPEGGSSDENFDYCAINKFNFAIRATSQGGGD